MNATHRVAWPKKFAFLLVVLCLHVFSQSSVGQSTKGSGGKACPAHWKTHVCHDTVLCVDPEVEMKYSFEAPLKHVGCNPEVATNVIPASSIRGDPYLYGFSVGAGLVPGFWVRALMVDSSMVQDGDVEGALKSLGVGTYGANDWAHLENKGRINGSQAHNARLMLPTMKVSAEGRPACSSASSVHVCGSMILLCVAPEIERKYDLLDSEPFQKAYCDARPLSEPVPATAITGDPYKAGFSLGFMILPPKYVEVIKLDSLQIAGGDLDEALRKLDLRIPSDWETKFDEGLDAGGSALLEASDQADAKAKQMAK